MQRAAAVNRSVQQQQQQHPMALSADKSNRISANEFTHCS